MDRMPPRVEDLRRYIKDGKHAHLMDTYQDTVPDAGDGGGLASGSTDAAPGGSNAAPPSPKRVAWELPLTQMIEEQMDLELAPPPWVTVED